jgi:hypothetical protein
LQLGIEKSNSWKKRKREFAGDNSSLVGVQVPPHHYDEILEGFIRVVLKSAILDSVISKTLLIWIAIYLKYGKNQ